MVCPGVRTETIHHHIVHQGCCSRKNSHRNECRQIADESAIRLVGWDEVILIVPDAVVITWGKQLANRSVTLNSWRMGLGRYICKILVIGSGGLAVEVYISPASVSNHIRLCDVERNSQEIGHQRSCEHGSLTHSHRIRENLVGPGLRHISSIPVIGGIPAGREVRRPFWRSPVPQSCILRWHSTYY